MNSLLPDLRYALRVLRSRPSFTLVAVLSLAIGIGANTAIFSVVNGVLLKSVPGVTRPERLVEISQDVDGEWFDMSYPVVQHLTNEISILEDIAAFALVPASITGSGEPRVRGGLAVTSSYFKLLGVEAVRGRIPAEHEAAYPSVAAVAVITNELWTSEFGRSDDVIGREVRFNGYPVEVIGVLPAGFAGHHTGLLIDVFVPLGLAAPGLPSAAALDGPQSAAVEALGRLRPGISHAAAAEALSASAARFVRESAADASSNTFNVRVESWGPLPGTVRGAVAAFFAILSILVALALVMACMNVTSILLSRAAERRREFAIRLSLGATRFILCRQLVREALLLFAIAGIAGTAAAVWITGLLGSFSAPLPIPGRVGFDFGLDYRVLIFSIIVTVGAGLVFSLLPALRAGRFNLVPALKDGSGESAAGHTRFRSVLVGLQIGVTTLLLVVAGLFATSLKSMRVIDGGWQIDNVHVLDMNVELRGASQTEGRSFYESALERVRAIPGVEAASIAAKLPLAGCSSFGLVSVPGMQTPTGRFGLDACLNRVSADYFKTIGLPLLRGRDFTDQDDERGQRVAIINETLASRLWPDADPVGRQFFIQSFAPENAVLVIGVVADAKYRRLDEPPSNFYYVPAAQRYNSQMVLHVRSTPEMRSTVAQAIRRSIRELDPHLPLSSPRPMTEALELFFLPQRLAAWVSGAMGVFALLLASIGVYGITAFIVSGRTREFGIRLALGATKGDVVRLVLRQTSLAPLTGMVVGISVGLVFGTFVGNIVSGVSAANPVAFGVIPILIAAVVSGAILLPLWRVLRHDPMSSLRHE